MTRTRYVAERAGMLPGSTELILGGARFPAGRPITPDPSYSDDGASGPVMWITDEAVAEPHTIWQKVATSFASHGLWPLVFESLRGADDRPWHAGELAPSFSTRAEDHDAARVLAEWWSAGVPVKGEALEAFAALAPFRRAFPGLAPESPSKPDPDAPVHVVSGASGRLGLVPVTRPADVLAAIGWQGPVNHFSDMGKLGAVLRSWEERFGAYLVSVGFDTVMLAVERPPLSVEAATAIAAEHFAVCTDVIYQGVGSIEAYATELVGMPVWGFWWD